MMKVLKALLNFYGTEERSIILDDKQVLFLTYADILKRKVMSDKEHIANLGVEITGAVWQKIERLEN